MNIKKQIKNHEVGKIYVLKISKLKLYCQFIINFNDSTIFQVLTREREINSAKLSKYGFAR